MKPASWTAALALLLGTLPLTSAWAAQSFDLENDADVEALLEANPAGFEVRNDVAGAEANAFDWKSFIQQNKPATVKFVGIYIGGSRGFSQNETSLRFRPASTQKVFTASAYVEYEGWNANIPRFLKFSVNGIGDGILAPALGGGSLAKGAQKVEDYANAEIRAEMALQGIAPTTVTAKDDYLGKTVEIDPYKVSCTSGSGFDGANSVIRGAPDEDRSGVTAASMRLFLQALKKKKYFEDILASLPYAGQDGTLAGRMTTGAAKGAVAAKTGSLSGVKNLVGYVHTPRGGDDEYVPFVILIRKSTNTLELAAEAGFENKIVTKMAELLDATTIPIASKQASRAVAAKKKKKKPAVRAARRAV